MPYHHESLEQMRQLAETPTLGNLHPDARAQAIARDRLEWLHSPKSSNVDGYEWGIFRVKWEGGKAVEVWQTNGNFSDLDAAMGVAPAPAPSPTIDREKLVDAIAAGLGDTYHCTRVWNAWNVGTMTQDDFEPVDESNTPCELADAVLAMLAAAPAPAPAAAPEQALYVGNVNGVDCDPHNLAAHAIEELCQLGYTVRNNQLVPPDHLGALMQAAGVTLGGFRAPAPAPAPAASTAPAGQPKLDVDAQMELCRQYAHAYYCHYSGTESLQTLRRFETNLRAAIASTAPAPATSAQQGEPSELLVLLISHDGNDSPAVALARNRAELLEQVKVAVWGESNPADTTNDAGYDMAEGMTDTLLETGVMTFEGDPPLRLVRIPVDGWIATPTPASPAPAAPSVTRAAMASLSRALGNPLLVDADEGQGIDDALVTMAIKRLAETAVAVDLLRSAVMPLDAAAFKEDFEDGGQAISTLVDRLKGYIEQFDQARVAAAAAGGLTHG